jgi:hypothetical protein
MLRCVFYGAKKGKSLGNKLIERLFYIHTILTNHIVNICIGLGVSPLSRGLAEGTDATALSSIFSFFVISFTYTDGSQTHLSVICFHVCMGHSHILRACRLKTGGGLGIIVSQYIYPCVTGLVISCNNYNSISYHLSRIRATLLNNSFFFSPNRESNKPYPCGTDDLHETLTEPRDESQRRP